MSNLFQNRIQSALLIIFCLWISLSAVQGQVKVFSEQEVQNQQLLIEAVQLKQQAKYDEAYKKIDELIRLEPGNAAAYFELSRIQILSKNIPEASKAAEEAFAIEPDNYWYGDHLASLCVEGEKYGRAAEIYTQIGKYHPRDEEIHYKAAYCYLKAGDSGKALKILDELEDNMGIRESISQKKFDIYMGIDKPKKAVRELEKLIAEYPENTQYMYNLASYLMQNGEKGKADEWFRKILELDPDHTSSRLALQLNDSKAGSDVSYLYSIRGLIENRSIPLDNKILELIPYVEKNAGLQDEALDHILLELVQLLEQVNPAEAKVYALKGDLYFNMEDFEKAKEAYIQSLNFDRSVYAVWANLLHSIYFLGDAPQLAGYAEQAIDFFPNQPLSYYYFGKSYWMRGKQEKAIENMKEGLLISGKNNPLRYDIQNDLIQLNIQINNLNEAQRILDRLEKEELFQVHPILLETAGDLAFIQGKKEEAIQWWTRAEKAGNKNPLLKEKIGQKKLIK